MRVLMDDFELANGGGQMEIGRLWTVWRIESEMQVGILTINLVLTLDCINQSLRSKCNGSMAKVEPAFRLQNVRSAQQKPDIFTREYRQEGVQVGTR